jgi:hypothetical protein
MLFSFYWMFVLNREKFIALDGTFEGGGVFGIGIVLFVLMISLLLFLAQSGSE